MKKSLLKSRDFRFLVKILSLKTYLAKIMQNPLEILKIEEYTSFCFEDITKIQINII